MNKKFNWGVLGICVFLIAFWSAVVFAIVDHDPWDGTKWDGTAPNINQPIGDHYKEMYDLRLGVGTRMNRGHDDMAAVSGAAGGGWHYCGF